MPLLFWLPIILLDGMLAVAADDLQKLTSVQLQAFQSLLATDPSQRTPPITMSLTMSSFIASDFIAIDLTDKRAQGESVPVTDRAWQRGALSSDTQRAIVDRQGVAL